MNQPAKSHEPSMEEILASIRRIIADEDTGKAAKPAAAPVPPAPKPMPVPPPVAARPAPPPAPPPPPKPPEAVNNQADIDAMLASMGAPGRKDEAADIWKRALAANEAEIEVVGWPRQMGRAIVRANLGDADQAFAELDAAYDGGFRFLYGYRCIPCVDPAFFDRNGFFQPIFDDPRFADYVERIRKENAEILKRLDRKYGFLEKIRADMAAQ